MSDDSYCIPPKAGRTLECFEKGAVAELRAEIERLRKEIDGIIGMCLGNVGIGQIHAKAMRALEEK